MSNAIHCKVCYDAGKPSADYNSHYVRDQPGGKVVCPTILNQNCSYCKKTGHTPVCCPKLAGKYKKQQVKPLQQVPEPKTQVVKQQKERVQEQFAKQMRQGAAADEPQLSNSQQRARELCNSPPPKEKRTNYFNSLSKIMEEDNQQSNQQSKHQQSSQQLNDNFPVVSAKNNRNDGGSTILRPRPANNSVLKCWSDIVAKEPTTTEAATEKYLKDIRKEEEQAQRDQAERDQAERDQAQQAQAQQIQAQQIQAKRDQAKRAEVKAQAQAERAQKAQQAQEQEQQAQQAQEQESKPLFTPLPLSRSWFYEE